MGEPQPLDAQSTKLVLIALLRAVSRMKGVLEEPDRAVLKDMVVDEPLRPELLRIGIRMAILDNDPRSGSAGGRPDSPSKKARPPPVTVDLCKGAQESSDGEYEDDYESEDDDDMMMPDEDAVRDDQADSTAEPDEEEARPAQVREIAATVAKQKELLAEKMRLVEDQLSRFFHRVEDQLSRLTALKSWKPRRGCGRRNRRRRTRTTVRTRRRTEGSVEEGPGRGLGRVGRRRRSGVRPGPRRGGGVLV